MKEGQKKGYTLTTKGLVANRTDGRVVYFSNEITRVEEFVEDLSGARLKEGDQIYLAPPDRITSVKLHKYEDKTLRQQLNLRRKEEPDYDVFLAHGTQKTFVGGVEEQEPMKVNILILRKK